MKEEKDIFKNTIVSGFNQETPSNDFTNKVMQKIEYSLDHPTVVKPLISKKMWIIILSVLGVVLFGSFIIDTVQTINLKTNHWVETIKSIHWSNYKNTFKMLIFILFVLIVMSVSDMFYRKWKIIHHK